MRHTFEASENDSSFYLERTDRNIGWLLPEEQAYLKQCSIGVAGNGGMGGLAGAIAARLGILRVVIADNQVFDLSNMNRQFAARKDTVGESKALATAKEIRRITDDVRIEVFDDGVNAATAADFVNGCSVVLDEIEFFAVSGRIALHQAARAAGVPILNCNTPGFGLRLFLFTPESMTVEEAFGFGYEEAVALEEQAAKGEGPERQAAIGKISETVLRVFVPELQSYRAGDVARVFERLQAGKASIVGSNPPMSTGFVMDQVLFLLLRQFGSDMSGVVEPPKMPGYLFFDAAKMQAHVVEGKWW